ncbi:Conserved_hypothetical protein [Hexamita inflata]|uniref:Uncharacterized protein n=1 Tax=Hexamita inflata TaxID=28002 RepID=A0AA86V0B3_9EUKA|nr:Conserved hypothetical protein [Hexamita inflata]
MTLDTTILKEEYQFIIEQSLQTIRQLSTMRRKDIKRNHIYKDLSQLMTKINVELTQIQSEFSISVPLTIGIYIQTFETYQSKLYEQKYNARVIMIGQTNDQVSIESEYDTLMEQLEQIKYSFDTIIEQLKSIDQIQSKQLNDLNSILAQNKFESQSSKSDSIIETIVEQKKAKPEIKENIEQQIDQLMHKSSIIEQSTILEQQLNKSSNEEQQNGLQLSKLFPDSWQQISKNQKPQVFVSKSPMARIQVQKEQITTQPTIQPQQQPQYNNTQMQPQGPSLAESKISFNHSLIDQFESTGLQSFVPLDYIDEEVLQAPVIKQEKKKSEFKPKIEREPSHIEISHDSSGAKATMPLLLLDPLPSQPVQSSIYNAQVQQPVQQQYMQQYQQQQPVQQNTQQQVPEPIPEVVPKRQIKIITKQKPLPEKSSSPKQLQVKVKQTNKQNELKIQPEPKINEIKTEENEVQKLKKELEELKKELNEERNQRKKLEEFVHMKFAQLQME